VSAETVTVEYIDGSRSTYSEMLAAALEQQLANVDEIGAWQEASIELQELVVALLRMRAFFGAHGDHSVTKAFRQVVSPKGELFVSLGIVTGSDFIGLTEDLIDGFVWPETVWCPERVGTDGTNEK
jgi:hypothetical protein